MWHMLLEHMAIEHGIYPAQLKRISNFSNDATSFVTASLFVTSSTATWIPAQEINK